MNPENPDYPSGIESITLDVAGFQIAALRCKSEQTNNKAVKRMLCVHGWLDNAASFVPLMQVLDDVDMVAIDLPGHGRSDHLGPAGNYSLAETALLIPQVADALGWQNCHLMGHSLGGNLSILAIVAAPEKFTSLVLIESTGPLTEPPESISKRLEKAATDRKAKDKYKSRVFSDTETAVASRLAAARMSHDAAQLVVERQLKPTKVSKEAGNNSDGYLWRFDPRLRLTTPIYLTEEQVRALLATVMQPALAVVADDGYLSARDETAPRLALLQKGQVASVPGNHHMHMDDPLPSGSAISTHLARFDP